METELNQLVTNFKNNYFVNENTVYCDFDKLEWIITRNEEDEEEGEPESYTMSTYIRFRVNPYAEFGTTKKNVDKYIRKLKKLIKDTYKHYNVESLTDSSCGKQFIYINITHK